MKKFSLIIFLCFLSYNSYAELLKPSPLLNPSQVIMIQLLALNNNDYPNTNFGIKQTWEFAHPNNKIYTGPLEKFTKMMFSPSYKVMINHKSHKINEIQSSENIALFFVEIEDLNGLRFKFNWIVEKVIDQGSYYNCWMTTLVSIPIRYGEST